MKTLKQNLLIIVSIMALLVSATGRAEILSTTYYHNDLLGSPIAATDEAGNVKWTEQYRPYGERILKEPAADKNTRWYTGHAHDEDTGLTYMGARYYDPIVGRFMAMDPVGFSEGNVHSFNRYAYGNNNPYKYVDPDGREPLTWMSANRRDGDTSRASFFMGAAVSGGITTAAVIASGGPVGAVADATGIPIVSKKQIVELVTKRVGRHMSPEELAKMKKTGRVQEGGGGQTRVADPANPNAYRNAPAGDKYVEFDVPADRIKPHSQGTGRIPGPNSPDARAAARNGSDLSRFEMPPATNIKEF